MNVQKHPNGVTLAGFGFRPSQLRGKPVSQNRDGLRSKARSKVSKRDALLGVIPNDWQSGCAIIKAASLAPSSRNYAVLKALVADGVLETKLLTHASGNRVQYRRARTP